jgi:serine/threonine-protein kinase
VTAPTLHLLGGTSLAGVPPDDARLLLGQSKTVALLAYLLLAQSGLRQRRDRLAGLLWPTLDQGHARSALRKTVHAVRSVLGADAIVSFGDEELLIGPSAPWCDAVEFETAIDAGRLGRALELYRGDLMPGFHLPDCGEFDRWLEETRAAALERAVAATWALARECEAHERFTDAGYWARVTARRAWTDERVLRRALIMLDRVGDRAGAISLYDGFARRLRSELETEPSAETTALVARLRSR